MEIPTIDDNFTPGNAALARKSRLVDISGRRVSSIKSEPVWVRRYADETTIDRLNARSDQWRITDRLWRAGCIFRGKWLACRLPARVVASYGPPGGGGGADRAAWLYHLLDAREAVEEARGACPASGWLAVCAVAGEDEPARGRWYDLRDGLDALADFWDIPADYSRWEMRRGASV